MCVGIVGRAPDGVIGPVGLYGAYDDSGREFLSCASVSLGWAATDRSDEAMLGAMSDDFFGRPLFNAGAGCALETTLECSDETCC